MRALHCLFIFVLSFSSYAHGEGTFLLLVKIARYLSAPIHSHSVDFLVGPLGTVYPVPLGAIGPVPVVNCNGRQTGIAFVNGKNPKICTIRIMRQTPARGRSPGYPKGYVKYENVNKHGVDPYTWQQLSNKHSHFSIE